MSTITIKMDFHEFLELHGSSPLLKPFSQEAIKEIFDNIEIGEEWQSYFERAAEYTAYFLATQLCLRFHTQHTAELIGIAFDSGVRMDDMPCNCEHRENCTCELDDLDFMEVDSRYDILNNSDFQFNVIEFFKEEESIDVIELDNLNWLQLKAEY